MSTETVTQVEILADNKDNQTPADNKAKPSVKTPADNKAKPSVKTPADKAKPSVKIPADNKAKPSVKIPADNKVKTPADKVSVIANRLSVKKYPALIGRKFSGIGCIGEIGDISPSKFYGKVEFTIKDENGILSAVKTKSAAMPPFPYIGQIPASDRKSPFRGEGQFLTKKHLNAGETDFTDEILAYEIGK